MQQNLLSGNALSVIVGGRYVHPTHPFHNPKLYSTSIQTNKPPSETTGTALIILFYLLSLHPQHISQIHTELLPLPTPHDAHTLSTLPHLNACIHESMRLIPAALTQGSRITGPTGFRIDDVFIPPGVKICAPRYTIFRRMYFTFAF